MTEAPTTSPGPELIAYLVGEGSGTPLVAAPRGRAWMDRTNERFANRCLPLLIANQAGWFVLGSHTVRVTWTGGAAPDGLTIECLAGAPPGPAVSHFGHGILTFHLPYLFRTSPGWNLLVRGPANLPKDGVASLEGLVESDWSSATFTINWQLTRAHLPVTFERGEPLCQLVPQRRGELESFRPELRAIASDPDLMERYRQWSTGRGEFNAGLRSPGSEAGRQRWQKHYFQGRLPDGTAAPAHQTKLALAEFAGSRGELPNLPAARVEPVTPASDSAAGAQVTTPAGEALLRELIVQEDFIDAATCRALVDVHQRFGAVGVHSDNGYPVARARTEDPARHLLARGLVQRMLGVIRDRYRQGAGAPLGCDLALLCALAGGFRHRLHADNARLVCPRHGADAEELRRVGCQCPDAEPEPNHTPWRRFAAMLYLSGDHQGGDIVFGEGPNRFGGLYRRQIQVRPGLLVVSPCDARFFHCTTPVVEGVRYSMNCWFTDDPQRISAEWTA